MEYHQFESTANSLKHGWGQNTKKQSEMEAIEKIQNQSLKEILHIAVTTRQ